MFSTIRSSLNLLTQELMVPNFLNYFLLVIIHLCFCVSEKKKKGRKGVLSDVKEGVEVLEVRSGRFLKVVEVR